jgi:hypothetical protein
MRKDNLKSATTLGLAMAFVVLTVTATQPAQAQTYNVITISPAEQIGAPRSLASSNSSSTSRRRCALMVKNLPDRPIDTETGVFSVLRRTSVPEL